MDVVSAAVGSVLGYLVAERDPRSPNGVKVSVVSDKPSVLYGRVYENQVTMTDDSQSRLHDKPTLVSDIIVLVSGNDMLFGNESNQRFSVPSGASFSITKVDLSTLWFRNATPGSNGTINIIGTREK